MLSRRQQEIEEALDLTKNQAGTQREDRLTLGVVAAVGILHAESRIEGSYKRTSGGGLDRSRVCVRAAAGYVAA